MQYLLAIFGIVLSFVLIKYRQKVGDVMGEGEWMKYFGGVYGFIIVVAIFIFLWSLATLFGTTDALFAPLLWLIPGARNAQPPVGL